MDSLINENIKKRLPSKDLKPNLDENGIDGCIAVQADQSENENEFLLNLAEKILL